MTAPNPITELRKHANARYARRFDLAVGIALLIAGLIGLAGYALSFAIQVHGGG